MPSQRKLPSITRLLVATVALWGSAGLAQVRTGEAGQERPEPKPAPAVTGRQLPLVVERDIQPCENVRGVRLETIEPGVSASAFSFALGVLPGSGNWAGSPRCLRQGDIDAIRSAVEGSIVSNGYLSTRLAFGKDALVDGILTMTVFPGRVSQVVVKPIAWDVAVTACSPKTQQETRLSPLGIVGAIGESQPGLEIDAPGSGPNTETALPSIISKLRYRQDLEEGIYNLRKPSSVTACFSLLPGAAAGESTLVLLWSRLRAIRLNLTVDDSGTEATGKTQSTLSGECTNCLALNDIITASTTRSVGSSATDGQGTRAQAVSVWAPLRYWKFGGEVSRSNYSQKVAGLNETYVYSGTSTTFSLRVARTVYRGDASRVEVSGNVWTRASTNSIDDTEIEVQRRKMAGWGIEVIRESTVWGGAEFNVKLGYKRGTGAFGSIPAPEEAFGEGTARPGIVTLSSVLRGPLLLSSPELVTFSIEFRGQWNRTPLIPQDRFSIGGRNSVRGFDGESTLSADRGWLLRSDLRAPVPVGSTFVYLGVDHGSVGGPSASRLVARKLSGAAIGVQSRTSLMGTELAADLFVGKPIGGPSGFPTSKTSTGFLLSASY